MADVNIVSAPARQSAAQSPVVMTLASDPTGSTGFATVIFSGMDAVAVGDTLTANGLVFTATDATALDYGEFPDTTTAGTAGAVCTNLKRLVEDTPLIADYYVRISGDAIPTFSLIARKPGNAYNITAASTGGIVLDDAGVEVNPVYTLGLDNKRRAALYVELWAYDSATLRDFPTDPGAEEEATLVETLELPYTAGNSYPFDLAAYLQQALTRALPQVPYFIKYGERFAPDGSEYRIKLETGRWPVSGVAWAFDAVDVTLNPKDAFDGLAFINYADVDNPTWLTHYFGPRPLRKGADCLFAQSLILPAIGWEVQYSAIDYAGATTTPTAYTVEAATRGGITDVKAIAAAVDSHEVLRIRPATEEHTGAYLDFYRMEYAPDLWLRFRNRLGGLEQWPVFTELPGQAASRSTYQPADGTTRTGRVEVTQTRRYYTGLLTREQYDFLRADLDGSPDVVASLPSDLSGDLDVAVRITDFDAKPDPVNGEYRIEIELTDVAPFTPLAAG